MARARLAAYAAFLVVLLLGVAGSPPSARPVALGAAAAVTWPPSAGLLVAEVVTGGASASDEYVELANAGATSLDLAGLEVAYATSSGATVTRKASWTATRIVEPGQHVLIANAAGIFAGAADATYSGGIAATGGSLVLRPTGGTPIDAVGWGDAVNPFVEGTAAAAPAAGHSIERLPGGSGGNSVDTNDNAGDLVGNAAPNPEGLGSGPQPTPTPAPTATPAPSPTPTPTVAPTPTPTPAPTPAPTATVAPTATPTVAPTPTPTVAPTPTPTPAPTAVPTPTPTPTPAPTPTPTVAPTPTPAPTATPEPTATPTVEPTPAPTPTPTPAPTPSPSPEVMTSIADARALPDDARVTIEGTLTTGLAVLESGRTGFIQDATAGIALYLDAALPAPIPAGTVVRVPGVLDSRFSLRVLRVAGADVLALGPGTLPEPMEIGTGDLGEPVEGLRVTISGELTESPSALTDGLGLMVDDGTGAVRVIVGADALAGQVVATGSLVTATGPLGQRDSSGTGLAGYRLHATLPGELVVAPAATPTPAPTATPSPTPAPTGTPSPTGTPAPTTTPNPTPTAGPTATPAPTGTPAPTPTATPAPTSTPTPAPTTTPLTVAVARHLPEGGSATVRGVVVAEAGRLDTPLFAIADATGGIPVKLADGQAGPPRGTLVEVRGAIAAPYGQTELRLVVGGLTRLGTATPPGPVALEAGAVGEANEGRLATIVGTITTSATKATSGDLAFVIEGRDGATLRVQADGSAGLDPASLRKGTAVTLTGIVGQRASRKGALDGYRLWVRDRADVAIRASATPTPRPSASPTPAASFVPKVSIAAARLRDGSRVTIEGVVTVDRTLLDASGRRAIVEDATGAIELYLATPDATIRSGVRVRATGTVGRAWGAPRLRADAIRVLGTATPRPRDLHAAPTASNEWRLVRVRGTVADVHKDGEAWTAELQVGAARVPLKGLAGSGIASSALVEGRAATVIGVVKRAYPTATDQRFSIVPRRPVDIVLGAAVPATANGGPGTSAASSAGIPGGGASPAPTGALPATAGRDVALADLAGHVGESVRVGGLVAAIDGADVVLDDGTASAIIALEGDALDLATLLAPGDAVNATGSVVERDGEAALVVSDPSAVSLLGDLGAGDEPSASPAAMGATVMETPLPGDGATDLDAAAPASARDREPVVAGVVGLLVAVGLGAAAAARRTLRLRRRTRARIQARIDAIAGPRQGAVDAPAGP